MNMKELNDFVIAASRIKNEKDVVALYEKYKALFHAQGWAVSDAGELRGKLGELRAAASMTIIRGRIDAGEIREKPSKKRGVSGEFIASVLDTDGNVATYLGYETDEDGHETPVQKPLTSGHARYFDAEKWLLRVLADKGGPNYTGIIESDKLPVASTFTRELAIFRTWGARKVGASMHKAPQGASGPWMKQANTTRVTFSRG